MTRRVAAPCSNPAKRYSSVPLSTPGVEARQMEVARRIVAVQRQYVSCFQYKGDTRPSRAVHKCMVECEQVFSEACEYEAEELFDLAEHLAAVTARMIEREAPKFAADPKRWIELREELRI